MLMRSFKVGSTKTVQMEKGTMATPFEFRPYQVELQLCQRYYYKSYPSSIAPGYVVTPITASLCSIVVNSIANYWNCFSNRNGKYSHYFREQPQNGSGRILKSGTDVAIGGTYPSTKSVV